MRILVINCGSSSLKFKLYDLGTSEAGFLLAEGVVEEIGRDKSKFTYKTHKLPNKLVLEVVAKDHTQAVAAMKDALLHPEYGLFRDKIQVDAVGHRVVHGGEKFSGAALVTPGVRAAIEECIAIAPLHNPPNLSGIAACDAIFPGLPQVAVFDTAFHQSMPPHVFLYALPYEQYDKFHIRKYGFHGTSHEFVARRAAELLKKDFDKVRLITCHMGNGSSITAVKNGKSFDTSMGLTPLEGVVMGTRTGDMDPAVVLYIMEKQKLSPQEMNKLLNSSSGVKGISGISNDMRLLMEKADEGNVRAQLALDIFVYRVVKYIGSYVAAMGGVDAIVFTGGIGENASAVRAKILEPLAFIGVDLDPVRNGSDGKEKVITRDGSRVAAWVVPTNEELSIAQKTKTIVERADKAG
jgi:acetate kinase